MAAGKGAEIRAGIVMIAGLAVLAVGLFLVSGGAEQFKEKRRYSIYFEDAGGIQGGDEVTLSGQHVGYVVSVDEKEVPKEGKQRRLVEVVIEIYADKVVETDAQVTISQTITGIVSMSILHGTSAIHADQNTILFGNKTATFEEAIGNANSLLADAREVVAHVNQAAKDIEQVMSDLRANGLAQDVDAFLQKLNDTASEVNAIVKDARQPVTDTLEHARKAASNLESLTASIKDDGWPKANEKLQAALDNVRAASEKLDSILAENRPDIRLLVQNLKDASLRVAPTLERIESLARSAGDTVDDLRPRLVATVDSARKAMENFKSVTEDLKTAPWKLVNKPSGKESDEVHLYNAARLYVSAAEEIGLRVGELEALQRRGGLGDESRRAELESALAALRASLADYDRHEKEIVRLLASGPSKN